MYGDSVGELARQVQICNACRYCESFCSVFPAMHAERRFASGDLTQIANLCHNCQNCYSACQFTAPHEFEINLPKALAELRHESWQDTAFPSAFGRVFHRSGALIALALVVGLSLLLALVWALPGAGEGFYSALSHGAMVAIFLPAFLLPLVALAVGLHRYWVRVGGTRVRLTDLRAAFGSAAQMRNLAGGHGEGCNFEDENRFSQARRIAHQLTMYGFLLCFAATSTGTIMHYIFGMPAPYGLFSLPKLLGIGGGVMLCTGTAWMLRLKHQSRSELEPVGVRGGDYGFVVLLFAVSFSGLALYTLGGTAWMSALLAVHLGTVLTLFLLTPYTKFAHGFYRIAALTRDAQRKGPTG